MSWRVIIGIIVRHLTKKCGFRDLNRACRFSQELRMLGFWVWAQLNCMDLRYFAVKDQFAYSSVNAVFCVCVCVCVYIYIYKSVNRWEIAWFFWLLPLYKLDLPSSGVLRRVDWWLLADISGQPTAPHSELPLEVDTDRLSRNIGNWLPINAVWHHRRVKISVGWLLRYSGTAVFGLQRQYIALLICAGTVRCV